MKITKMRKQGVVPHDFEMNEIINDIRFNMERTGFITDVTHLTSSSIKVGMHMCSFRINPKIRGYNADTGRCGSQCKAGFKRTTIPTWDERKLFNHIVNNVLDGHGIQANIKSGDYTIRSFSNGRVSSWNPHTSANGDRHYYEIAKVSQLETPLLSQAVKSTKLMLIQGGAA